MSKTPQSRPDVPWTKRQEIPDIQILDAAHQKETRYPFEPGCDLTRYNHGHLVRLADFLGHFVRNLPPTAHIEWKP